MAVQLSIFFISLVGIVCLISFRIWEMKRGVRVFNEKRTALDTKAHTHITRARNRVPALDQSAFLKVYHAVVHTFAVGTIALTKSVEKRMVALATHARGKRDVPRGVTQSDFLKRVSEHKQNLEKPTKDE